LAREEDNRAFKLGLHRAKAISAAGLKHLADFVTGDTPEKIDESIQSLLAREKKMEEKIAADALASRGVTIPTAAIPAGGGGQSGSGVGISRAEARNMPKDEWAKKRAELLARATGKT
jgi:hypothetical protein